jgi:predicted neuraminidase
VAAALLISAGTQAGWAADGSTKSQPGLVLQEFVYDDMPFPQCHASTIAETPQGLVAAWFGGTRERNPDVGIWIARRGKSGWSKVVEVANGVQSKDLRHPCWNPVLFQPPKGPLLLFYKVGPNPRTWWGMLITSKDGGKTWSKPRRLPDGIAGPIKNKPMLLADGTLLCGSSTEDVGWRVHMEKTKDFGKTWSRSGVLNDGKTFGAIQPAIIQHGKAIRVLCRSRQGQIVESTSRDGGNTWSKLAATSLPNPNSGIDAVTLKDGRSLLVYNHTKRGRSPLNVAVSVDGKGWKSSIILEDQPGEYSYPATIQSADGLVHITYTWKRQRVKHVVLDPAQLRIDGGADKK